MALGQDSYDVFVSYSRADHRHASDIDDALRGAGLATFFDRRNLDPGLPWVRALEQAIGKCKAVVVLIGPNGFGNTQQYKRDLAFFRQTREPDFPVVPVILSTTARRSGEVLSGILRRRTRNRCVQAIGRWSCDKLGIGKLFAQGFAHPIDSHKRAQPTRLIKSCIRCLMAKWLCRIAPVALPG